jgi:hypothetical protein
VFYELVLVLAPNQDGTHDDLLKRVYEHFVTEETIEQLLFLPECLLLL